MTARLSTPSAGAALVPAEHPTAGFLPGLARAWGDWRTYRRTLADLRALSPRELEDIGHAGADLDAVARGAV